MILSIVMSLVSCKSEPIPESAPIEPPPEIVEEVIEPPTELNHQPHVVSLSFTQDEYIYSDRIGVEYETFDPDGDPTREELFWSVNGQELISEKGRNLRRKNLKKGDEVAVTLVVKDGVLENQQFITMRQDGLIKVLLGETTLEEVYRVTANEEEEEELLAATAAPNPGSQLVGGETK